MEQLRKKHAQKIRYGLVGIANTVLDFGLLFIFVNVFGIDKIVANYFSTGVAMIFSFYANRHYAFKQTEGKQQTQFVLFVVVTVIGMWVIQPLVIWSVTSAVDSFVSNHSLQLFIAKVIATGASLVWNYIFYSRLVFKKNANRIE